MLIPITISEEGVLVELLYSVIQRQNQLSFQSKLKGMMKLYSSTSLIISELKQKYS